MTLLYKVLTQLTMNVKFHYIIHCFCMLLGHGCIIILSAIILYKHTQMFPVGDSILSQHSIGIHSKLKDYIRKMPLATETRLKRL